MAEGMNPQQDQALHHVEGPLLILAGAGSGKTRVVTHRIAYLIDEIGVNPYNILAITFTNKAAGEMRERVDSLVGFGAESIWVSTFHSLCVRILRRWSERLDYDRSFTIYDTDDQKSVVKEVVKYLQLDPKMYPEKMLLGEIARAKEKFIAPHEYDIQAQGNFRKMQIARVYSEYQKRLRSNNALDFDDLLYKTVELFQFHPDVLDYYQERFRYIMVDEYQDTNHIQFLMIKMLAAKYRNLCVVGDDDQSIYKFRGANIYNILNFEQEYPDAVVIKLEQNYRSTSNILQAANGVISHNQGRKDKKLWTTAEAGEPVHFAQYENEYQEAEMVTDKIIRISAKEQAEYSDFAILYRTNAQSRIFEEKLLMRNIPYKLVGGTNFYSRKEIKDLICYLKTIANGSDDLAVKRVINVPKRGIGATTVGKIEEYARMREMSFMDALLEAEGIPGLGKAVAKLEPFTNLICEMRRKLEAGEAIIDVYREILDRTGYKEELILEHTPESQARLENIAELENKIAKYEEEAEEPTLEGLLEEIALVADVDSLDESDNRVVLMTMHSAKGLEFPYVFIGGMEERLFPSGMAVSEEDEEAIEEERRLCYVGITRAKKELYLSCAKMRMIHGATNANPVSRFIKEIPRELLDMGSGRQANMSKQGLTQTRPATSTTFKTKPYAGVLRQPQSFPVQGNVELEYGVGDRVKHMKFGIGTVREIVPSGRDYEVTVTFDTVGDKRMFASFAKLKKA